MITKRICLLLVFALLFGCTAPMAAAADVPALREPVVLLPDEASPDEASPDQATPDQATPDEATFDEATPDESQKTEVNVGDSWTVTAASGDMPADLRFIPRENMTIEFYAESDGDTYGILYDGDYNQLICDDDSGDGCNFRIVYDVEAGQTYYLNASFFYNEDSGSFRVYLNQTEKLLQLQKGSNSLQYHGDEGQLKCQYLSLEWGYYCVQIPDMTGIAEVEITSQFSSYELGEPITSSDIRVTVTPKAADAPLDFTVVISDYHYPELQIGRNTFTRASGAHMARFEFHPAESGYYRMTAQAQTGILFTFILTPAYNYSFDEAFPSGSNTADYVEVTFEDDAGAFDYTIVVEKIQETEAVFGDMDGDGVVDVCDTVFIQRFLSEIELPFLFDEPTADVDGDGDVTPVDVTCIQMVLADMDVPNRVGQPIL